MKNSKQKHALTSEIPTLTSTAIPEHRRPEIYVGSRISQIVFEHEELPPGKRTPESNYRIAADGFIEVTKEIIETSENMRRLEAPKNHGVKLFFVCTYKNKHEKVLVFCRLGAPKETQTFRDVHHDLMSRFHVNGWYKLHVSLEKLFESNQAEPYMVDETNTYPNGSNPPEFVSRPCRICTTICYFEKDGLYVCNVCQAKKECYVELIRETEWQPIETAPFDSWVITLRGELVEVAKFTKTGNIDEQLRYGKAEGWLSTSGGWFGGEPSHWQPLPNPPKKH